MKNNDTFNDYVFSITLITFPLVQKILLENFVDLAELILNTHISFWKYVKYFII